MTGPLPAELIKPGTARDAAWLYGRLLFRSPSLLGAKAVRIGLSCNSCHTNGDVNRDFYIEGLSDRPGRIDLSHHFWQAGQEDHRKDPIPIPSLRGVAETAPYGSLKIFPSLSSFTRHVIVEEFAGPNPTKEQMNALLTYLNSLDFKNANAPQERAKASPDALYLTLLEAPLRQKDFRRLDALVDLIRADFGRSVQEENPARAVRIVKGLLALRTYAAGGDYQAARAEYLTLIQ